MTERDHLVRRDEANSKIASHIPITLVDLRQLLQDIKQSEQAVAIPGRQYPDLSAVSLEDGVQVYYRDATQDRLLSPQQELLLGKMIALGLGAEVIHASQETSEANQERWCPIQGIEDIDALLTTCIEKGQIARNILVESNTRLVISIAKKHMYRGLDYLDLIQHGNLGLIHAADRFDYTKGNRFSTFATWWIRQHISRAILNHGKTIRIPVGKYPALQKINAFVIEHEKTKGSRPTYSQIGEALGISKSVVRSLLSVSDDLRSLSEPVARNDADDRVLGDFIPDEGNQTAEQAAESVTHAQIISRMQKELSDRELKIVMARFGFDGNGSATLEEIAVDYDLSKERIRQIIAGVIEKLKQDSYFSELGMPS